MSVVVRPPGQGGGGGVDNSVTIVQNFNVSPGADVDTFRRTLRQSTGRLVRQIREAQRAI